MEQKKKIKVIIIVLACLLGLSLLALGGTLIYNKIANTASATVTVPDNLITPDEDTSNPDNSESQAPDSSESNSQAPNRSDTQAPRRRCFFLRRDSHAKHDRRSKESSDHRTV